MNLKSRLDALEKVFTACRACGNGSGRLRVSRREFGQPEVDVNGPATDRCPLCGREQETTEVCEVIVATPEQARLAKSLTDGGGDEF